jgi:hypothetical protein
VIEETLSFRDYAGDHQRQLFLVDHAGLPLKSVLEQIDMLSDAVRQTVAGNHPSHEYLKEGLR